MRILIVGHGGRESALAMKLKDDKRITGLYFAKGNATTDHLGKNFNEEDIVAMRDFALKERIDLAIVGPEAPLVDGIVDEFEKNGIRVFGPNKKAASLEGSKAFSKKFMQTHNVKTAKAKIFDSYKEACEYIKTTSYPTVIKASGLAGGKGVVICEDLEEAQATLDDFMIRRIFGDAGIRVVIEDYLKGFEASIIAFSNGKKLFPCIPVKDYKKAGNKDKGPNTGGMGSVAPSPEFTMVHMADFQKNILEPTMKGLQEENIQFHGVIFFGLMVTQDGCYCLEYNMRLGDPETQVIMPLLENNLYDLIDDCLHEKDIELKFKDEKAVCLVMCSGGYPRNIETGFEIKGLDKVKHSQVLFAGARNQGDRVITTGGRVLNLVATASTYKEARDKVYADALPVRFDYCFYREDIADFH
ncbi:phosphoribosylamine--glycine ligase [Riemerella columbipharyngis]|uniref:Phosphoribosylamine--glycine ligase n=1 Tax=Riemerella columbipharyngis TaxID=1071918 RepID=A0A1G6ZKU9_9FLAO|nr:phosphoribosylamine--glycine ligase [Riemerella columbipharyngis]SDE03161.1 phosphoribosylamine--glycine ligase [Riemerella columbipharyngis]